MHQPEVNAGKLDNKSAMDLGRLFADVADFCSNEETFQLLLLLTMLDTEGMSNTRSYCHVFRMRDFYLKLYQRKLYAANCNSFMDYAKFRRTLSKIKLVTNLVELYIAKESYS